MNAEEDKEDIRITIGSGLPEYKLPQIGPLHAGLKNDDILEHSLQSLVLQPTDRQESEH